MSSIKTKKGGLGKGLSALLQSAETDPTVSGEYKALNSVSHILISSIEANPFQPRTEFEEHALNELAESIKIHGLVQPVTVRKMGYDKFQLISGERRTRAAKIAGLEQIPAYIRLANDQDMLEMALIENIQRQNLNPIEVSISYKRLLEECNLKQEELGERVGKDRSTVANYMRLLKLPENIQLAIKSLELSMGHAKALLGVENEEDCQALFYRIINEDLSVRETERIIKESRNDPDANKSEKKKRDIKSDFEHQSLSLTNKYDMKVSIRVKPKGKGELKFSFNSEDELERLLELL